MDNGGLVFILNFSVSRMDSIVAYLRLPCSGCTWRYW